MTSDLLEKVLINQFGAIKPPWMHQDDFYKLVFNYCDRWCERCTLSKVCRVYQETIKRDKRFIKQGVNPKSSKAMFITLKENFEEIRSLLEKNIKRLNIKITKEDEEKSNQEYDEKEKLTKSDKLYQISLKLSYSLVKLVEDLHYYFLEEEAPNTKETLRILTYYMHFFAVKIYRAINSSIEEEAMEDDCTFDSKNSAFLAYIAIIKIINALKNISSLKTLSVSLSKKIRKHIMLFEDLNIIINDRFQIQLNDSLQ